MKIDWKVVVPITVLLLFLTSMFVFYKPVEGLTSSSSRSGPDETLMVLEDVVKNLKRNNQSQSQYIAKYGDRIKDALVQLATVADQSIVSSTVTAAISLPNTEYANAKISELPKIDIPEYWVKIRDLCDIGVGYLKRQ